MSEPLVLAAVALSGGAAATIDLRTRRVPNQLTLAIGVLGLTLSVLHVTHVTPAGALAGFVLGLLLMLPGHFIGATGAGDV